MTAYRELFNYVNRSNVQRGRCKQAGLGERRVSRNHSNFVGKLLTRRIRRLIGGYTLVLWIKAFQLKSNVNSPCDSACSPIPVRHLLLPCLDAHCLAMNFQSLRNRIIKPSSVRWIFNLQILSFAFGKQENSPVVIISLYCLSLHFRK